MAAGAVKGLCLSYLRKEREFSSEGNSGQGDGGRTGSILAQFQNESWALTRPSDLLLTLQKCPTGKVPQTAFKT